MTDSPLAQPKALGPDYIPDALVNRDEETVRLIDVLSTPGSHIHVYGPRGTGKTLLTRNTLDDPTVDADTCVLSCTRSDTQYKVLAQLADTLTGTDIGSGHHTAQLQDHLADHLSDTALVIVLDDIDFLLANDGNDLLYYLSRLGHDALTIVTLSAAHSDLSAVIDERTYSTLQPKQLTLNPYTITETYRILDQRARTALSRDHPFPKDALSTIAMDTANISLGLFWLHTAADAADDRITEDLVHNVRSDAVQRYRHHLLTDFSPHHQLLCDAINSLTDDTDPVHTGTIYDRYETRCRSDGRESLTTRRLSDYLKDLERLGIIQADYHYGGAEGKTREIQLIEG